MPARTVTVKIFKNCFKKCFKPGLKSDEELFFNMDPAALNHACRALLNCLILVFISILVKLDWFSKRDLMEFKTKLT